MGNEYEFLYKQEGSILSGIWNYNNERKTGMNKTCKNCRYFDHVDKWCLIIGESKNKNNECRAVDSEGKLFWTEGKIQDWVINYGKECN